MKQRKIRVWDTLSKSMIYADKGYQGHYVLTLKKEFYNLQNGSGGDDYIVMDSTGLSDKNGKEIYEGDIVSVSFDKDLTINYSVKFGKHSDNLDYYRIGFYLDESDYYANVSLFATDVLEIIGNIFENPDLSTQYE